MSDTSIDVLRTHHEIKLYQNLDTEKNMQFSVFFLYVQCAGEQAVITEYVLISLMLSNVLLLSSV